MKLPDGVNFKLHKNTSLVKVLLVGACMAGVCDTDDGTPCKTCVFSEANSGEYSDEEKWGALKHVLNL